MTIRDIFMLFHTFSLLSNNKKYNSYYWSIYEYDLLYYF